MKNRPGARRSSIFRSSARCRLPSKVRCDGAICTNSLAADRSSEFSQRSTEEPAVESRARGPRTPVRRVRQKKQSTVGQRVSSRPILSSLTPSRSTLYFSAAAHSQPCPNKQLHRRLPLKRGESAQEAFGDAPTPARARLCHLSS